MTAYAPPGWPDRVPPPGSPGWETAAVAYLLDCCPADFRRYAVLRNHPVVLSQFAGRFVVGQDRTMHEGVAEVRTQLKGFADPPVVEAAAQAWLEQGAQLARTRRAVGLLDEALRGGSFVRKL
jgi:CO/xanthine dehydrogenase FAD-binding subunit